MCGQCTRWRASCSTCSGRPVQILLSTSGWCLSFSSLTECFFLVVNRDRYPQLLCSSAWVSGCCSTLIWSSSAWGRGCSKEFHTYSSCCSRCLLGIWTLFPRAPCIWQPPAPVRCDHGGFLTNFFPFLREKWTPITLQFTLGNLELFLRAVIWQSPRASVYVAFGRISHIFIVLVVPDSPRSSHLKSGHYFYSQSYGGGTGFFDSSDAFFGFLQVVWS